jgi:hypothetical protein
MPADSDSDGYPRAPAQKARDENIIEVFEGIDDPVLTTAEVAEELPIGKRATLNRLEDLADREEIDSKDVGVGRVWWRTDAEDADVGAADAQPPEPAAPEPPASPPTSQSAEAQGPTEVAETGGSDLESPRWAFIGSLGRHSIYAGVFLIGLLLTESVTAQTTLLPVSKTRLFVTGFVFFLIGFPARGAYRAKKYFESTDHSFGEFLGPLGRSGQSGDTDR